MRRRLVVMITAGALGVGAAVGVSACGSDSNGDTVTDLKTQVETSVKDTVAPPTTTTAPTTPTTSGGGGGYGY
ncbi:MAG: hypothetical protein EXQ70_11775 [Solirubrobacterales bacterium]|nr:hypothetical protein [Solirubrobacterales bacterium]